MANRKAKLFLRLLLLYIVLFCLTLIVLTIFYWQKFLLKPSLLSPLAHVSAPRKTTAANFSSRQLADLLHKYNINFISITLPNTNSVVIKLNNTEEAVISLNKDLNSQISSLQLMMSRLTIEGESFKRLDFRFERPVISF